MIGERAGIVVIRQKLGEGGMGAVYLAEHEVIGRQFAVKVLLPQWTQNPMIVQRFRNEAITMGALKHPNIIEITDCNQLANGAWYITMEYLSGRTLKQVGAGLGPLSIHLALQILCQVAAGLKAAHKRGIVHRDLKPDNIFTIVQGGNSYFVKLLDWGISKLGDQEAGSAITSTGMIAGTPAYMAPEQMRDLRTVDHRADIYALGVITYQLVTGGWFPYQRPDRPEEFKQLSAPAMHELQLHGTPLDPRRHVATIPEGWWTAIRAAIDPDPARRPQGVAEFIRMLAVATPSDGQRTGTDIVSQYAPELFELGNLDATYKAPVRGKQKPTSRYRIEGKLGAGGMAEVFRATFVGAEGVTRPVAIKRVLPGFSETPQFASMFVQEAQLASMLRHPNIVSVLDFDRDEEQRLFLAMEFVEGRDLATLAATGRLPLSVIVFIIVEVLHGLGYAHELPTAEGPRGVIHRDVSPQNVLLSWEGAVQVSDFGIAKARTANDATASTMVKGKPQYMSPEQANGEPLDGRSDLFAVGIMLWELLAGRRLFDGTTQQALIAITTGRIPAPSTVRSDIPPGLEAVTMRLLARDRNYRFANAREVIAALSPFATATGKTELIAALQTRFPEAIAARSGNTPSSSQPPTSRQTPFALTQKDPAPQPTPVGAWPTPTTLGAASGQSVTSSPKSRAPLIVASVVAVAVGMGGAFVGLAMRKHGGSVTSATPGAGREVEPSPSPPSATHPASADTVPATAPQRPQGPAPSGSVSAPAPIDAGPAAAAADARKEPPASVPVASTPPVLSHRHQPSSHTQTPPTATAQPVADPKHQEPAHVPPADAAPQKPTKTINPDDAFGD